MSNILIYLSNNSVISIPFESSYDINFNVTNQGEAVDREQIICRQEYNGNENYTLLLKPILLSIKNEEIDKVEWVCNEQLIAEMNNGIHFIYSLTTIPVLNIIQESINFVYAEYDSSNSNTIE